MSKAHRPPRQLQVPQDPEGRAARATSTFSLPDAEKNGLKGISRLPYSMKVLLENLLRHEDGRSVTKARHLGHGRSGWTTRARAEKEIGFRPARVLMQDFTGVPAVVDLAAMRDGMKALEGRPREDQSAGAGRSRHRPFGHRRRVRHAEVVRPERGARISSATSERYNFLKWGQGAFKNFRVVPPGTGICHQVNLEYLSQTVWTAEGEDGDDLRLSRHARRHRQPHDDGQRAWPCSAGASAASRRRRRCSASRSRC